MATFNYRQAFSSNIGLISESEQEILKMKTVAIAGLGGLGGFYVNGLARLGIGKFIIADGDHFEEGNINRQDGCRQSTIGLEKAEVMRNTIKDINPSAEVIVMKKYLNEDDLDEFLSGADVLIDAIEIFTPKIHRSILNKAYEKGIPSFFGAPLGWTASSIAFHPNLMSPEKWFDWKSAKNSDESLVHLILGVAPSVLHNGDMDLNYVDLEKHKGPSNVSSCFLNAGIILQLVQNTLIHKVVQRNDFAPYYIQFSSSKKKLSYKKNKYGNASWLQRFKKYIMIKKYHSTVTV